MMEKLQAELVEIRIRLSGSEKARAESDEQLTRPLKQAHEIVASQIDRQEGWIRTLQESVGALKAKTEENENALRAITANEALSQARSDEDAARAGAAIQALEQARDQALAAIQAQTATPVPAQSSEQNVKESYDRLNSLFSLKLATLEERLGSRFASREPTQSSLQKFRKDLEEARAENDELRDVVKTLMERVSKLEAAAITKPATAKKSSRKKPGVSQATN